MTITIEKLDRGYELHSDLLLPVDRESLFPFFADASNLEQLTPPTLHFRILTPTPIDMREGALIDYRLRLHGFPFRWRTEISAWEPTTRFVDRQIRGPYRWWIHEHTFETTDEGTLVKDRVKYDFWGSSILNSLLVRRDLGKIFEFRRTALQKLFGMADIPSPPTPQGIS